jgi:hypothetical protein
VKVCVVLSWFVTVIVLPAFTVVVAGWKAKFLIVTLPLVAAALVLVVAALVLVAPLVVVVVLELLLPPPQAANAVARPTTTATDVAKLVSRRTSRSFRPAGSHHVLDQSGRAAPPSSAPSASLEEPSRSPLT